MPAVSPSVPNSDALQQERLELLDMARRLDQFGRHVERFLTLQLQQLEAAVADFERERAAWRRQHQREQGSVPASPVRSGKGREAAGDEASMFEIAATSDAARGHAPLRVLLDPGSATAMQLGLLMFEISKLNRELGGEGVRFEVRGVRTAVRKRLFRGSGPEAAIIELEAFSHAPLTTLGQSGPRTCPDALASWEQFKSTLLMAGVFDEALDREFRGGAEAARDHAACVVVSEAARRADDANINAFRPDRRFGPAYQPAGNNDARVEQHRRFEQTAQRLKQDCNLRLRVSLV